MTGNEIKEIRLSLGMTQSKFAQAIGVQLATECKWENGKSAPRSEAILRQILKMKGRMIAKQIEKEGE